MRRLSRAAKDGPDRAGSDARVAPVASEPLLADVAAGASAGGGGVGRAEYDADTLSARSVEKLAARSAQGSHADFAELVRRYHERVYNFLVKRTRNPDEAADLTQEAFVRAWQRIDRYDPRWQFSTWIFTIAVRLSVSRQRREKRNVHGEDFDQRWSAKGEGALARMEQGESVAAGRALWELAESVLGEDQYLALWLRYAEGLSMSDIARVIGKSQVGVRVSLFRARASLAQAARRVPGLAREMDASGAMADGASGPLGDEGESARSRSLRAEAARATGGVR
jgi:RNA polymerase sigma-70 factor (ECF subfamily)